MKKRLGVIIAGGASPDWFEMKVAFRLLDFFDSSVEFLPRSQVRTPDLKVKKTGQTWEIKNIRGNGVNTIEHNLAKAKRQSENIVISLYRSKMTPKRAIGRIKAELKHNPDIKRVILVTKEGKVVKVK